MSIDWTLVISLDRFGGKRTVARHHLGTLSNSTLTLLGLVAPHVTSPSIPCLFYCIYSTRREVIPLFIGHVEHGPQQDEFVSELRVPTSTPETPVR